MKIHLDYLEGRVEELENANSKLAAEKKAWPKKMKEVEERAKREMENGEKRVKELQRELDMCKI
jgi:predicted RNase H-like nuclease (RuvC/YqgF family)